MSHCVKYILLLIYLCFSVSSATAQTSNIERFAEVVDSLHSNIVFPYNIGPGIVLTNIGVDKSNKMLVINYLLNPEFVESVVKNASSENGIAQLLTGYDEIFAISMIDAEAGYMINITSPSANGQNTTETIRVPATAIPIVFEKLKNGDTSSLKPYLEMLQSTFSNIHFPLKIVEGIYLTDAFVEGKEANWIYRIEGDIENESLTDTIIQNNRINLINNLRANMSPNYLVEIEEENITLHYTYLDREGTLLFEFRFTADDLK